MTRRDEIEGDFVGVSFDSYHDLRTSFNFFVSSTSVKMDFILSNDGQNTDPNWDPVWYVKTRILDFGWSAEMKIPFTQLRFNNTSGGIWGMEVIRQIDRYNETSYWQHIPRSSSGIVHLYGELGGLKEIKPRKIFDIIPYCVASLNSYESELGNPFSDGKDFVPDAGLDAKIGLTNNLTIDLTVNPDFGQVEADPSVVNLTAFETFFEEKRPFFIEGKNITRFATGIGDGDIGNDGLFYSKRIGREPQGSPSIENGEFADIPRNVRILGAAKVTGKTNNGWSIGIIESITPKTFAQIDSIGHRTKQVVEPLTNFLIGRIQKEINEGNTLVGGVITNTFRDLDSVNDLEKSDLNYLHTSATTGGIDFTQFFKEKNWRLKVAIAVSNVNGSQEAIAATQRSSRHLFQRPDADYLEYDPSRTFLTGQGGHVQFGKIGGKWRFDFSTLWKSPGYETNDVGYLKSADDITNVIWSTYMINKPFSIFRRIRFNTNHWVQHDFGGNFLSWGGDLSLSSQYTNLWRTALAINWNSQEMSKTILRGGPTMKIPGTIGLELSIGSDDRKRIAFTLSESNIWGQEGYSQSRSFNLMVTYRPINTLRLSLSPSFSKSKSDLQYITMAKKNDEFRYIFGRIDQTTLSMSLRINYNITPDLSIQYWGQPFLAAGDYSEFKMISDKPTAQEYSDRFHIYSEQQIINIENVYMIDEAVDGSIDYSFDNPDFTFNEFLSNLVVRWEYIPGSTLFLVWSQTRSAEMNTGQFILHSNLTNLFAKGKPYNVYLLKFSYRFGLK